MANNIERIDNNLKTGRPWYEGLHGTWWWGMSDVEAKQRLLEMEKEKKIAIASIVRNEEHTGNLGRFLDCCRDLENYHHNIVYIFVEGDSTDRTYQVLKDWINAREDSGSILEKRDTGSPWYPKTRNPARTTHLADLRNVLIGLILSRSNIDEVLMIDASYGWKGDLIVTLRETNADIAAPMNVCHKHSDGNYVWYDIWAFRKNSGEFSPFYPYCQGFNFNDYMDISSCGGGYLVKRHVLEAGCRYIGGDCEHVNFCRDARSKGFSIKLNPKTYIRKGGYKE